MDGERSHDDHDAARENCDLVPDVGSGGLMLTTILDQIAVIATWRGLATAGIEMSPPPSLRAKKRHPNTKISPQNPMPESTFFRGLQPPKFFVFGAAFSLQNVGKLRTQRILKGGEGGRKKIFVLDFFGCFFRSLIPELKLQKRLSRRRKAYHLYPSTVVWQTEKRKADSRAGS